MTGKIIIPIQNNKKEYSSVGITEYLKCPDDKAFEKLCDDILDDKNATLTGFVYNLCLPKPLTVMATKHIIMSLFYEGRYIELLYFYNRYKSTFAPDKRLAILAAHARIKSGLLHTEDNIVKDCVSLGVEHFIILTIKMELALRAGRNDRAHELAIELYFVPVLDAQAFNIIIEAALRVDDTELINLTLLKAKKMDVRIVLSKSANNKIQKLQGILLCKFLGMRGKNV